MLDRSDAILWRSRSVAPMIRGDHVALASFEGSDRDILYQWINDPELVHFNSSWRPVHGPAHDDWFRALAQQADRVVFAVRHADSWGLIGLVQLIGIDAVHRNAEMVIRIGSAPDRSRGLGTEAVRLLLGFAWADLNLHRVSARAFSTNERAIRCYQRAGFTIEGRQRDAAFIDGAWVDLVLMGAINPKS